jgi:hypothetical protein
MNTAPKGVNAGLDFLIQRALEVRQEYAELEKENHGRSWTNQEVVLGLVGNVGDLERRPWPLKPTRVTPYGEGSGIVPGLLSGWQS